jgi:hypothetical protein
MRFLTLESTSTATVTRASCTTARCARFGKHARNMEIQLFAVAIRSSCVTKVSCDQHTLGQAANLDGAIQLWFADDKIASFGDVGISESLISVVPLETPTEWLVNCMGEHGLHVRVTTWCGCRATAKIIELYGRVRVPYDVANNFRMKCMAYWFMFLLFNMLVCFLQTFLFAMDRFDQMKQRC